MDLQKEQAFTLLNSLTTGDVSLLTELLDPAFEEVEPPKAVAKGLQGLQEKLSLFHQVHGNVTLKLFKQIAQNNAVCSQWLLTATIKDPGLPEDEAAQVVRMPGVSWTYFVNGKIIKNRVYGDMVGYLQQRGYRWANTGMNGGASAAQAMETQ
jgi:hypothetical protein